MGKLLHRLKTVRLIKSHLISLSNAIIKDWSFTVKTFLYNINDCLQK